MIRSLPRLLRNGTFRTAAACALALLLAAAVPEAFSLESPSFAQTNTDGEQEKQKPEGSPDRNKADEDDEEVDVVTRHVVEKHKIDDSQLILSGIVLAFLIIVLLTIRHMFRKHIHDKTRTIERITVVAILVMGSLFLVTSGLNSVHIAPAFGLFGMIGGYLLGQIVPWKQCRHSEEKPKNEPDGKH